MIYKTVSLKTVIAKVYQDFDLTESVLSVDKMIEWSASALRKIGGFSQNVTKVTGKNDIDLLEVKNFILPYPCDLVSVNQVAIGQSEEGAFMVINKSVSPFGSDQQLLTSSQISILNSSSQTIYRYDSNGNVIITDTETTLNMPQDGVLDRRRSFTTIPSNIQFGEVTFKMEPGFLRFNVKECFVMLSYQAIPTDCDGYPLIPDDEAYFEAIYWYVLMKHHFPKYIAGLINKQMYDMMVMNWERHRNNAYAHATMPDIHELEAIKNSWVRLKPTPNEFKNGFQTLSKEQRIRGFNTW